MGRKCPKGEQAAIWGGRDGRPLLAIVGDYYTISNNSTPGAPKMLHRFLYSLAYGEPTGLVVHHRNGDKFDNRLKNLQAMTNSEHMAEHARMKREFLTK